MNKTQVKSTPEIINRPGPVRTVCNSITFINQGTSTIALDGCITILPGQQYYEPGNEGEIYNESIMLSQVTAGTMVVLVIRKNYV